MNKLIEVLTIPIAKTIIEPPYEYTDSSIEMQQIEIKIHKSFSRAMLNEMFTYERTIADRNVFRKEWENDKNNLLSDLSRILANLSQKENVLSIRMLTSNLTDSEWEELMKMTGDKIDFNKRKTYTFDKFKNKLEWEVYYISALR